MQSSALLALLLDVLPDSGPVTVQGAKQGLINETFKVTRGDSVYACRVAADSDVDLGVDREWETRVVRCAAEAGLAPPLIYSDAAHGILISRWVGRGRIGLGRGAEVPAVAASMSRVALLLRQIHALQLALPVRRMNPADWIDLYVAASTLRSLPVEPVLMRAARQRLRDFDACEPGRSTLCHSDLHTLNLIDDGGSLLLLDWEYAHVSDPLWDVAGWCSNNDFAAEQCANFIAAYLGHTPSDSQQARFAALLWCYDYIALLWSRLTLSFGVLGELPSVSERAGCLEARLHAQLTAH